MSPDDAPLPPYHPAAEPPHLRASDEQREVVARIVRDALEDGRLQITEIDERLEAVYSARTHGDLATIVNDLSRYVPPPPPLIPYQGSASDITPQISERKRLTALLLSFFLGVLAIHRFYAGRIGSGVAMLILGICTLGIVSGVWALIDLVIIASGHFKDGDEKLIREWT